MKLSAVEQIAQTTFQPKILTKVLPILPRLKIFFYAEKDQFANLG